MSPRKRNGLLLVVAVSLLTVLAGRTLQADNHGKAETAVKAGDCGSCEGGPAMKMDLAEGKRACGDKPARGPKACGEMKGKSCPDGACGQRCGKMMAGRLKEAVGAVEAATKAVEADEKAAALEHLAKAKGLLAMPCRKAAADCASCGCDGETTGKQCAEAGACGDKQCRPGEKAKAACGEAKCS